MNTIITKKYFKIFQKLSIAYRKNHLCEKWPSDQFQSTLQNWLLLKKVEFLGRRSGAYGAQYMWYEILHPSFLCSSLCIFYIKMFASEEGSGRGGGGGVLQFCISCIVTENPTTHISIFERQIYYYEWVKRIKFILAVIYGSPRRHSNSSTPFKKKTEKN